MSDDDGERTRARKARRAERQARENERRKRLGVQDGQSEKERIATRQDFRRLIDRTKRAKGAIVSGNRQLFKEIVNEHDVLHEKVLHPSEANLDVEELSLLASITADKTKKMAENFTSISADDYVTKIKSLFSLNVDMDDDDDATGTKNIDWQMLGMHPLNRIRSVNTVDFLPNVLDLEIVAVKKTHAARTVREVDTEAEQVQALQTTEKLIKTQTENRVQLLLKILESIFCESPTGIPLLHLVVNPGSFGQSVENLFDLSFLIGSGHAAFVHNTELDEIFVRKADVPDKIGGKGQNIPQLQSIITMTYELWNDAIEAYGIDEPIIPDRKSLVFLP